MKTKFTFPKPSMQQDSHPEHNMPAPDYNGEPAPTDDYFNIKRQREEAALLQ